jgi:membrane associated rhomboid family serine protease
MSLLSYPRITPWVGRLIAANAVVLLLLETIFTAPGIRMALAFDPAAVGSQPWGLVTYLFVHGGLLHLLANSIALFVFGCAVEERMGSRNFLLYYLYCGVGAAAFCWALAKVMTVSPIVGASGAILGVAVAFALYWPDARLFVFPIPVPIRARTLVLAFVALDVALALLAPSDGIAHVAHIGGAIFGFLFFRLQASQGRGIQPRPAERLVRVPPVAQEAAMGRRSPPGIVRPRPRPESDATSAELDRLLDKISAKGIGSLTQTERRFLDEVSKKKQSGRREDGKTGSSYR